MCLDDRGRLWVAEAYSYPIRRPDKDAKDRILIFEDTDGDGKFDKRTVFMEGLNLVSGLEVGFGGVWVGAAPYLLFVPIKDGEDRPAGRRQDAARRLGLPGHARDAQHLQLGPGRLAVRLPRRLHALAASASRARPTPSARRSTPASGATIRPGTSSRSSPTAPATRGAWTSTTHGQAFCEACVIPHAFHIIQGGRYHRQAGRHFNPYTYADIKTIADHLHYLGANAARRQQPLRQQPAAATPTAAP